MKNFFPETALFFGLDGSFQYSEEQQRRYVADYLKAIGQPRYQPTTRTPSDIFTGAPVAARRAKRKAWTAASVILFKPQLGRRMVYGTRY